MANSPFTVNSASTSVSSGTTVGNTGNAYGVSLTGSGDVLTNSGTILGTQAVIDSGSGDTVSNLGGGYLGGSLASSAGTTGMGVYFFSGSNGVLINAGTIKAQQGVEVLESGVVTISNQSGGYIDGATYSAVYEDPNGSSTSVVLVNAGRIVSNDASYAAVALGKGGTVVNQAGGVIDDPSSGLAISIYGGTGTVTNAGTIDGGVSLASGFSGNRVIVDPGAVFTGTVSGGGGVLELASSASTGTLTGADYTNFVTTTLDSGSHWLIKGGASLASEVGTIAGFAATDTIQITGDDTVLGQSYGSGVTHVTLTGAAPMTLNFQGTLPALQASYSGGVTNLMESTGPALTVGGNVTFTGGGSAVVLDSTATVSDTGSITGATVSIGGFVAGDQLNFSSQNGITGSFNSTTGVLTLTGTTSATNYQAALRSITFNEASPNDDPTNAGNHTSRTIGWTVVDASGSTSGSSGIVTQEASVLNYGETIQENGIVATSETVNAGVMTLANSGGTVVGHVTVGSSLSTGEFLLSNSGGNSTIVLDSVFGTYNSGITLLTNPTTIAPTGRVSNSVAAGVAVNGPGGTTWTLANSGQVSATGPGHSYGVELATNSILTNTASGTIAGYYGGVGAAAGVTIGNAGTIRQTGAGGGEVLRFSSSGSVSNSGLLSGAFNGITGDGMVIANTGTILAGSQAVHIQGVVLNGSAGSTTALISGSSVGIYVGGASSTMVNYGTIAGALGITAGTYGGVHPDTVIDAGTITGTGGTAIALQAAANLVKLLPGFAIQGTVSGGNGGATLELASAASPGTLSGLGTQFVGFSQVTIDSSASWVLSGYDTIAGGVTLTNAGTDTVLGTLVNAGRITGASYALFLGTGGQITNQSGGTITGTFGAIAGVGAGTIVNAGLVSGGYGMYLAAGGVVTNQSGGQISATGFGIRAYNNATVSNQSGGTISGAIAVGGRYTPFAVINAGLLAGATSSSGNYGVVGYSGGTVTNLSGGTIIGHEAVNVQGTVGTVVNAGSIQGTTLGVYVEAGGTVTNTGQIAGGTDAVKFKAGFTNRLIIGPTASFTGTVDGGNTIGAASISTLELASGASTGTLSGFGSSIVNFAQIAVDANATWSIASGLSGFATLTDAGTVVNGVTLGSGTPTVSVQSGGVITAASNALVDSTGAATVVNAGSIGGNAGNGFGVELDDGGLVSNQSGGRITGYSGVLISGAAATVSNAGYIDGAYGVSLGAGGLVTNATGGTIVGDTGVFIGGAAGTVQNAGVIDGNPTAGGRGVFLGDGGVVTNAATGTITAAGNGIFITGAVGTVLNLGAVIAGSIPGSGYGVYLNNGGTVINGQAGGTASAAFIGGYGGGVRINVLGTVVNYGTLNGDPASDGVHMAAGLVINGPSGDTGAKIIADGGNDGVLIEGAGTVVNYGSITDGHPSLSYYGVNLGGGGVIQNLGTAALIEGYVGVTASGGATVTNAGTIETNNTAGASAAALEFGTGTNRLILDPGAVFIGKVDGGNTIGSGTISTLELASGATPGAISGLGTQFVNFAQVTVDSGALWYLAGTNTIASGVTLTNAGADIVIGTLTNAGLVTGTSTGLVLGTGGQVTNVSGGIIAATGASGVAVSAAGAGTLVNAGLVTGNSASGKGVSLFNGTSIINQSGGTLQGSDGVYGNGGSATISNAGLIEGTATTGTGIYVYGTAFVTNLSGGLISGGFGVVGTALTVVNAGSIAGDATAVTGRSGVKLLGGGSVSNLAGGVITGDYAVYNASGAATVTNAGSIGGVYGVVLDGTGSSVINQSGGVISGSSVGVFANPAATVVNAGLITGAGSGIYLAKGGTVTNQSGGTISGAGGALSFGAGYTGRLVIDPGAMFIGTVDGGNPIGSATASTLELASGASEGTLNGFGSQYINFSQVTIDAGAQWDIVGSDATTALGGATVTGFTYGDTIDVTNFQATSETFFDNHLTLTNGVTSATLDVQGSFITQNFRITNAGTGTDITLGAAVLHYGDTAEEAGVVASSETVNAGQLTLFNSGNTAVGTIGVGTTLDSSDFQVSNDGTNSTIVVATVFGTYASGITLDVLSSTIAATASVSGSVASGAAVFGPSGTAWTLTNDGQVSDTASGGNGVSFASSGTVINAGGGSITGAASGVTLAGGGAVTNQSGGTIGGTYGIKSGGIGVTVANAGSILGAASYPGDGIYLGWGGTVTNQSGGVIAGYRGLIAFHLLATIDNAGIIAGNATHPIGEGINLQAGGLVTNAAGATISGGTGLGSYGQQTVVNAGTILGTFASGNGVALGANGLLTNQSGGVISGGADGVYVRYNLVTVVNAGTISGTTDAVRFRAGYTDRLVIDPGAVFSGTVDGGNTIGGASITTLELASAATAGTLSGLGAKYVDFAQITIDGGAQWMLAGYNTLAQGGTLTNGGTLTVAGTLVNDGLVTGTTRGLVLGAGALLSNQSGGVIAATAANGIAVASSGTDSVVNAGLISGDTATGEGVSFFAGGYLSNQSGGTISGAKAVYALTGALTVVNAGSLLGSASRGDAGVAMLAGGAVSNLSGGLITGDYAVVVYVDPGAVTNAGSIAGQYGVFLANGGSVTNQSGGTISASGEGVLVNSVPGTVVNAGFITGSSRGVALAAGGSVTNQSGGMLSGYSRGVNFSGYAGTLTNAGLILASISGASAIGVNFQNGGSVTNQSGGMISGATAVAVFGPGQVTNAGTISGTDTGINVQGAGTIINQAGAINGGTYAVNFAAGYTDRLVIDPGASFTGTVSGGNTVGAGAVSTLELASGASEGTLAGLGTQFIDFAQVTVDSSASWTLSGAIDGFSTLTNAGTLQGLVSLGAAGLTVSNLSGGTITGAGVAPAIMSSTAEVVNNAGLIEGLYGVLLDAGGLVSNASGGTISGGVGVLIGGTGTVQNAGYINGTAAAGVRLVAGETVSNQSGGTISGVLGIFATGGAASISNAGSIAGAPTGTKNAGIDLADGGVVSNLSGGVITGYYGVWATSAAAAVVNAGSIVGNAAETGGSGVYLSNGGAVTNQSGGVISGFYGVDAAQGAITVVNAGSISGNATATHGVGVYLGHGGSVTNLSGGTISGDFGIVGLGTAIAVQNAGLIAANPTGTHSAGIYLVPGGSVTNLSGGTISGGAGVVAFSAATVVNAGEIVTTLAADAGVIFITGGLLTNQSGGTISGGAYGVAANGSSTVINAGSISGASDAVSFTAGGTDRLVIDPGAVFSGTVDGGNTVGATAVSTLELASGASPGTLTGLGTQYVNFAQVTIDSGAQWMLAGSNSVASGITLNNSGTLTDTGTLSNAGSITGNGLRLDNGSFTNQAGGLLTATYIYGLTGSTNGVLNQGTIANTLGGSIYLNGTGNVTNATGAVIDNSYGVKLKGGEATLDNQGQLTATATVAAAYAAYLRNGGVLINGQGNGSSASTASIQGYYGAVFKSIDTVNQLGTLLNYGTITGTATAAASGAALDQGGVVVNGASGATGALIEGGRNGVYDADGTVTNYATIIGSNSAAPGYGVYIGTAGTVSNLGSAALIQGYVGVAIDDSGTVVNQGTIASSQGTIGTAISFTGGNARLIESPTATLVGGVYGGSGGTAVLELASAAGAGTIGGIGTNIVNFTSLVFDAGAQWTVAGNDSANGLGTLGITGFTYGDTIDLTNFTAVSRTFGSNTLVLTDAGGTQETLHIAGSFVTNEFQIATDGHSGTDVYVRQIPSITAGDTVTFAGGGSPVALDPALTVTDAAGTTLSSAAVWINSGSIAGDVLNYASLTGLGITGSFDAATGTLTLTGNATVADYQAALESVTYSFNPSNGDPTGGGGDTSRAIDWMTSDGTSISQTGSSTLDVVHVAPSVTASGTVGFGIGGTAVVLDPGITLSDPDSGGMLTGATIVVSGFQPGDMLNFVNSGGIIGSYSSSTGTLVLSGTASIASYESALASITYSSSASDPSAGGTEPTRGITWTVTDASSSNGVSNTGTTVLDVYGPQPIISGTSAVVATYIQPGSPAALDGSITLADSDSTTLSGATVTISGGYLAGDMLTAVTEGTAITAVYSDGTLTLSGTDTLADYQQVLRSVAYASTATDPTDGGGDTSRTITWQIDDGRGGNNLSNTGTTTVDTHVRPAVTAGNTVPFGVNGGPILVDAGLGVADADTNPILTGTVAITGGLLTGDVLAFNNGTDSETFGDGATLTANYDNGVLTFSEAGNQASAADWQQALRSVTFDNTGTDPTAGGSDPARTLTWTLNTADPAQTSVAVTSTIGVALPPVISGTVSGQTTTDEAATSPFSDVTITDPNAGQTETVTIVLSNAANGTLSNLDGGTFNDGTYVVTGSALAVTSAIDGLVFTPTAHEVVPGDTVTTGFSIAVTDSSGAISSDDTTSVIATAVNDPPVIVQAVNPLGDPNEDPAAPFSVLTIDDPDIGHTSDTLTVTLSDPAGGTLSNLSGGAYDAQTGVYSITGSAAQLTAALAALVFTPTAPPAGSFAATTQFTVSVTGPGGTASNDAISVTAVTQDVPGVPGGASTSTISVSPDGSNFAPAVAGETNEAIISAPTPGGTYTIPGGYQAAYLGGNADAALIDDTVNGAVLVGNSGNDTISAGANDVMLIGGGGNNIFQASGTGDDVDATGIATVRVSGTDDFVAATSGVTSIQSSGTGVGILGTQGDTMYVSMTDSDGLLAANGATVSASVAGTGDTLLGGAGAETVQASSSSLMFGGTGAITFIGTGEGTPTLVGAPSGNEMATVGGGGMLFAAESDNNATITGGAGTATLFGSSNTDLNLNGSGRAVYVAGGGNETLNASGSSGSNFIVGGSDSAGSQYMVGGSGSDTMLAGAGADTMVMGSGKEAAVFFANSTHGAHDFIMDFNPSNDTVWLLGYDPTKSASYLVEHATTNSGGVTLTLSDDTQITFTNLTNANQLNGKMLYG